MSYFRILQNNVRVRYVLTALTTLSIISYTFLLHSLNMSHARCRDCNGDFMYDVRRIVDELLLNGTTNVLPVNPAFVDYIHTPSDACVNKSDYFLVILVKSDAAHLPLRMAVRRTWGKVVHPNIKVVFLLGYYSIVQDLIDVEAKSEGDVLQGDFIDIYDNNINKTTMAYQWAVDNCINTQYLLFVDDDFFVNIININQYLLSLSSQETSQLFIGSIIYNGKPFRDKKSKWYITREEYPYRYYPDYPAGGAMLMSMSIAKRLKTAFPYVQFIHIDDCYLGLVAHQLKIRLQNEPRFDVKETPVMHLNRIFASHGYGDHRSLLVNWDIFLETVPINSSQQFYKSFIS